MQHLFRLGVDIDFSDDEGFTALHHAVLSGFEDCVQELRDRGSDVNALTPHGMPLNLAAQKERGHVISILVAARADKVRAVEFALAHGQRVGDLCTLLNIALVRATANPSSSSGIDGDGVLEEIRLAAPVTAEVDTRTGDEPNNLHHAANKESAAESDGVRLRDLQHGFSARRDESHIPDQESAACHVEEGDDQESHSTSQNPKVPFPVDHHSTTESALGYPDSDPGRKEIPTDGSLAGLSTERYQSETAKARNRQRFTRPIRRRSSGDQIAQNATDRPVWKSERTKNLSPRHRGNNSSSRRRELPALGNDVLTPDAANLESSAGHRVQVKMPKNSRATNNPKSLDVLKNAIRLLLAPEPHERRWSKGP
jgi:hypothetical protein